MQITPPGIRPHRRFTTDPENPKSSQKYPFQTAPPTALLGHGGKVLNGTGKEFLFHPTAARLVRAFSRGQTTIHGADPSELGLVLDANKIPNDDGLGHPVGARWDENNQALTHRVRLPNGSDLSDDVEESRGLEAMWRRAVKKKIGELIALAEDDWKIVTIAVQDNEIDFADTDRTWQVHAALGKCRFEGTLELRIKAVDGGGFTTSQVQRCKGKITDLYDFNYGAPKVNFIGFEIADPKNPARTQAGHATLANVPAPHAGRVFFTQVDIDVEPDENFLFIYRP